MLWFVLNSAGCPDLDRIQCTVSLTACSGILYILPCVQGPKLMEITPWRCFHCGQLPGVTEAICLHALSSVGDEGTALSPLAPHPNVPMLLYSDHFICLNENQQKISITLPMYKQLQYCGHYSINMNVLLALSIPMLFHALLACSDPGRTL